MLALHGPTSSRAPGPNRSDANGKTPVTDVPTPSGPVRPRFEHDACGVALRRRHARAAEPRHRRARPRRRCATSTTAAPRAPRPTPATAPASSSRCPTLPPRPSSTSSCRRRARYADRHRVPARATDERAAGRSAAIEKIVADEGFAVLGWRDVPDRRLDDRRDRRATSMPTFRQMFVADGRRRVAGIELERHVVRRRASASSTRSSVVLPVAVGPHARLQGHAHAPPARASSIPTSPTSGSSRALALVHSRFSHQHVPVLAARAPVPLHRAQRRDQHGAGQRELDARPRGAAARATCSPATSSASSRSARPGASRHRPLRRGARAAAPRRPPAPRTRC